MKRSPLKARLAALEEKHSLQKVEIKLKTIFDFLLENDIFDSTAKIEVLKKKK
jgi:hypothetical protein